MLKPSQISVASVPPSVPVSTPTSTSKLPAKTWDELKERYDLGGTTFGNLGASYVGYKPYDFTLPTFILELIQSKGLFLAEQTLLQLASDNERKLATDLVL